MEMNKMESEDVVIGSGPCGYAAAKAIIDAGRHPLVIDFGSDPASSGAQIGKSATFAMKSDVGRTLVFGYPQQLITSADGKHLPLSNARGGLSTIWGAGILCRGISENPQMATIWPGVELGYQKLLQVIPHVGSVDMTSLRFPWPEGTDKAPQSDRFKLLTESLQTTSKGVLFGWPRVALDNENNKCIRCGTCLHGCPLELFASSRKMLEDYEARGQCTLFTGPALKIEIDNKRITIKTPKCLISAKRIFIAAGPIATPALLQRSSLIPSEIDVRDSAVFYTGFLNRITPNGTESDYTSAHLVAYSDAGGRGDFQLAIYESNPEYMDRFAAIVPQVRRIAKAPQKLISHLNAGIGFLDSSVSGSLKLVFKNGRTWVTRISSKETRKSANSVLKKVADATAKSGLYRIPKLVIIPAPGSGYHSGASMPMGGELIGMDCSLRGAKGVYVVDASVLPEIWAGAHTFTAMANAYRVVAESA